MTTAEKTSLLVSAIALIVAMGSPFVVYRWMQNDVRIQQTKATSLKVYETGISAMSTDGVLQNVSRTNTNWVENAGALPVEDVEMVLQHPSDVKFFDNVKVSVDPPVAIKKSLDKGRMSIEFEKALAPKQKVEVKISRDASASAASDLNDYSDVKAWIRSEALPMTAVRL